MDLLLNLDPADEILYREDLPNVFGHHITRIVTTQGGIFILDRTGDIEKFQCNYHYNLSDLGISPIYSIPSDDFTDVLF